jgi:hypothetical protein
MSKNIIQFTCSCGKEFEGEYKKTKMLIRLHEKQNKCIGRCLKDNEYDHFEIKRNVSQPKAHNGEVNFQKKVNLAAHTFQDTQII